MKVLRHLLASALCATCLCAFATPLWADGGFALDKVVITPSPTGGQVILNGRILDYTGTDLKFQDDATKTIRTYPSKQVQSVETLQTDEHNRGLRAFDENRIADAVTELTKALDDEPRSWVKREILAMLIRCALRQGDYYAAVTRFDQLFQSDSTTMYYKLIPLVWTSETQPSRLIDAARTWVKHKDEPMQLIGASVLLSTKQYAEDARVSLRGLMASVDERVYWLAEAQLWRPRVTAGNLDVAEVDRWLARIEKTPSELRGGPYFVVGEAYFRLQQYERASMMLLWVPMVYDDDYHLAARACFEAAEALLRIGQYTEANTLYRELPQRFGDSPYAVEAVKLLEAQVPKQQNEKSTTPDAK